MSKFANFIEEQCTGTGNTITLTGATQGSLPLSSHYSDTNTLSYIIEDGDGTNIVGGIGTYNTGGTITRSDSWTWNGTTYDDSPAGNLTLSGNTHTIRVTPLATDMLNWDLAYSWGNHAGLYAPLSHNHVIADITDFTDNSSNWDTAFGWGNHASQGYITSETSHADVVVDGDFTSEGLMKRDASSGAYSIVTDNSANWNTAFGWGDHAGLYISKEPVDMTTYHTLDFSTVSSRTITAAIGDNMLFGVDGVNWDAPDGEVAGIKGTAIDISNQAYSSMEMSNTDTSKFKTSTGFTFNFWIKQNGTWTTTSSPYLLYMYDAVSNNGAYIAADKVGGFIYPVVANSGSTSSAVLQPAQETAVDDNEWHMVTFTYNGDQRIELYVDGVIERVSTTQDMGTSGFSNLYLGGRDSGSNYITGSSYDEFKTWARPLTQAEITALYDATLEPIYATESHTHILADLPSNLAVTDATNTFLANQIIRGTGLSDNNVLAFLDFQDSAGTDLMEVGVETVSPPGSPPTDMAFYYDMTTNGSTLEDQTTNGVDATWNTVAGAVTGFDGEAGGARDFNSNSSVRAAISQATHNSILGSTTFTISLRVKFDSLSGNQYIFTNYDYGSGAVHIRGFNLFFWSSAPNKFRLTLANGSIQGVTGTTTPVTGTWYNVCATYDGTTARLYVDGNEESFATLTYTPPTSGDNNAFINTYENEFGSNTGPIDGQIDDVKFWTRALSPTEVQDVFDNNVAQTNASVVRGLDGDLLVQSRRADSSSSSIKLYTDVGGLETEQLSLSQNNALFTGIATIQKTVQPTLTLNDLTNNSYGDIVKNGDNLVLESGLSTDGATASSGHIYFQGYDGANIGNFQVFYNGVYRDIFHDGNADGKITALGYVKSGGGGGTLPSGGTAGQVLEKIDASDYNAQWADPSGAASTWTEVNTSLTLVAGDKLLVNATGSPVTYTLPATLTVGEEIIVHNNSSSTQTVSIDPATHSITGAAGTITSADTLTLAAGETIHMVARTTAIMELV